MTNKIKTKALIVLEDGTMFEGVSFGATGERYGEVVFNTSMMGYQEILTDPSYKGQIVTMTYPLIGNYGINSEDIEARKPFVEGFIVKESSIFASNWRCEKSLDQYLKEYNIVGVEGIDTRRLTRHIRLKGAMKAAISTENFDKKKLIEKVKASPGIVGRDLVKEVTCEQGYVWSKVKGKNKQLKVVVLDYGVKFNILRELINNGCYVSVVSGNATAEEILSKKPDGVLLSNGPGDPEGVPYAVKTAEKLIGEIPIFGICLGHQILALALGGKTYKLKFGHHGANHPVKDLKTGKIAITVQNHGFCVDVEEKKEGKYCMVGNNDVEITHINLNDGTCEGLRHKRLPIFSVQFHPEASPGPHDAQYLFREFVKMMVAKR